MSRSNLYLWLSLCLCACSGPTPPSAPEAAKSEEHSDEPEHEALPTRVRLSPKVIEAAKLKWAPVAKEALAAVLELPGEITADPDRMARVSVPVPGRIEVVDFRQGQRVKKGQWLATVRVIELPERLASLSAISSRSRAAMANADRLEALAKKGLAGAQEAETARAEAEALAAESRGETERLSALGAELAGARTSLLEVKAPLSGVVLERQAIVGDLADPEHPLATIADLDEVWFLGRVFERDLSAIKIGEPATVELNAFPQERFEGAVEYVAEQIDPVARTVVARIRLKNRDGLLRLGLFGSARVAVGTLTDAPVLVVPRSAITDLDNKPVVFVRQADGDFEQHVVVLGTESLGKVQIASGLREGELVVTEGAFTLKSAILKSTFGEED